MHRLILALLVFLVACDVVLTQPIPCDTTDGIVVGHSNAERWGRVTETRYGWVNAGVGGRDLTDWLDDPRSFDRAVALDPDAVLVVTVISERVGGRNTARNHAAIATFEERLPEFVDEIEQRWPGARIVLRSRMTGEFSETGRNGEPWTEMHNHIMRALAEADERVEYVDVHAGGTGYYVRDDFAADGVHPLRSGAEKATDLFHALACVTG